MWCPQSTLGILRGKLWSAAATRGESAAALHTFIMSASASHGGRDCAEVRIDKEYRFETDKRAPPWLTPSEGTRNSSSTASCSALNTTPRVQPARRTAICSYSDRAR